MRWMLFGIPILDFIGWATIAISAVGIAANQAAKDVSFLRLRFPEGILRGRSSYLPLTFLLVGCAFLGVSRLGAQRPRPLTATAASSAPAAPIAVAAKAGTAADSKPSNNLEPLSHLKAGAPEAPSAPDARAPNVTVSGSPNSIIAPSGGVNTINVGIHEPNAIYQDGIKVGTVKGVALKDGNIVFSEIRFNESVDTTKSIQFQKYSMLCDTKSVVSDAVMYVDLVQEVFCKIKSGL